MTGSRPLIALLAGALCIGVTESASGYAIEFSAERLETGELSVSDVQLHSLGGGGALRWRALNFRDIEYSLTQAEVRCDTWIGFDGAWCEGGSWKMVIESANQSVQLPLEGVLETLSAGASGWTIRSGIRSDAFEAAAGWESAAGGRWWLDIDGQELASLPLAGMLPEAWSWIRQGRVSGRLGTAKDGGQPDASAPQDIQLDLRFEAVAFDSPDGLFAAENLAFTSAGQVRLAQEPGDEDVSTATLAGSVQAGQLLLGDFYTDFSHYDLDFQAAVQWNSEQVRVNPLRLSDRQSMELTGDIRLGLDDSEEALSYRVSDLEFRFPVAYQRFLEPVMAAWSLDGLDLSGAVSWSGEGQFGAFPHGVLQLSDFSVVDNRRGRFAVTGLEAVVPVGKAEAVSELSWRGLLVQRINLGSGQLQLRTAPGEFHLASPIRLDVLGGTVEVSAFGLALPGEGSESGEQPAASGPEIAVDIVLDSLELKALGQALGWPEFAGTINGRIPAMQWRGGVLQIVGDVELDVFDGRLVIRDMRAERLFGVLPSLAANLDIADIDLEQLTSAFSFGRIAGRLDGEIRDLRMLDWQPVAFDAWFGTPESQQNSQAISRQAVTNLTELGGGGATAALTGPLMRLFNNFSYRRLGLGCRLENNVCELRGLEGDAGSVLLLEGAGVPKIMIRAFNRRMDWPQLVANLQAATRGGEIRVGD